MITKVVYVKHPFGGDLSKLDATEAWCAFLTSRFDALFVAPWVPLCRHWANNGISLERGFALDCGFIARSDSCIAVGGRWSTNMLRERAHAEKVNRSVYDATQYRTPNALLADIDAMTAIANIYGWAK